MPTTIYWYQSDDEQKEIYYKWKERREEMEQKKEVRRWKDTETLENVNEELKEYMLSDIVDIIEDYIDEDILIEYSDSGIDSDSDSDVWFEGGDGYSRRYDRFEYNPRELK